MADCCVIGGVLWYCRRYMMRKCELLLSESRSDRKELDKETMLLVFCAVIRVLMDLTFYIIFPLAFAMSDKNSDE